MKKFTVEIKTALNPEIWDADAVGDYIEAEDAAEAIEFARDYLKNCIIDNDVLSTEEVESECEKVDVNYAFRVREVIDESFGEYGEWQLEG